MSEPAPQRKRRVRYQGTHPHRFEEKYKEHDPGRYAADVERIIGRGKTPAGTHRPICVAEIIGILDPQPGQTGLDATLGYGGHARELLARVLPGGRLFGIDVDRAELARTEARLRAQGFDERVLVIRQINFAGIPKLLEPAGGGFDFILADLGVSSMQLDNPARGFTYKREGPLDLRLNPERGQPASALIKRVTARELEELLRENADEPFARQIAETIQQDSTTIGTTTALADAVRTAVAQAFPGGDREEVETSVRRTFQALRIAVNDEFSALDAFLRNLPFCLRPGGRVAVLSFHSGEDRRVKKAFAAGAENGVFAEISRDPIRPSAQERHQNPRAKSAILRWAVRS